MTARIHYRSNKGKDLTDFTDALEFFKGYGITPDEWQETVFADWLARRKDGKWAHGRCGLSVPRQNGKSLLLELRIIFGMVFLEEKILFSSHEVRSAKQIFLRMAALFENPKHPELMGLVKHIRRTNGQEGVYLTNGGSVDFIARTKGGGRGFTVDTLILDECQSLNADAFAALLPATSAAPQGNPQVILVGTPPSDTGDGEIFTNYRNAALEETDDRMSWIEFSAEPGDDADDRELWITTNPALEAGRLDMETVEGERNTLPEDVFLRERLGVWGSAQGVSVVPMDVWQKLADGNSKQGRELVLAIDMSPSRSTTTTAIASNIGTDENPKIHVEYVDNRQGTGWVLSRVIQLVKDHGIKTVVLDAAGPAATLVDELKKKRIRVVTTQPRDMAIACGLFVDGVNESTLVHLDQPALNIAVASARKRKLQDAFAWARSTATSDITPLVAVTLAHWGVKNSKVKKTKDGTTKAHNRRRAHILR